MMNQPMPLASVDEERIKYVCGIDIGSQSCTSCVCRSDKTLIGKPLAFANSKQGWTMLLEQLAPLDAAPSQILIGMEATARYWENLYHELKRCGYHLCLLHPRQTHQFHERQGLRAKTDQLDAQTIARVLLSGEARAGYVPSDQVAAYRELARLHTHLSDEAARSRNEIRSLVGILFPEFTQVFADPCLPNALSVLKAYPTAQAIVQAGARAIAQVLRAQTPAHYGLPTAEKLVALATESVKSGYALASRAVSLQVICDQLEHTRENLARLEEEIERLLADDPQVQGLRQIPEFGSTTIAVLRGELGDVARFARTDQAIAYGGLDIQIKESGQWRGKAKLSKRGSGLLRRFLYLAAWRSMHTQGSPFGTYYHRLVARGLKKGAALLAVMRKFLAVAVHLMKTGETYDPGKVCAGAA